MKRISVFLICMSLMVSCAASQAATIYQINFDSTPTAYTSGPYVAGPGDILPTGISSLALDNQSIATPSVQGLQGGNVLSQPLGAAWPNIQGYRFGADGTQFTGTPGPVIANSYTIEAVVKPDLSGCAFGKTALSNIFNSQHLGDGSSWGDIALNVDQNTGIVTFSNSLTGLSDVTSSVALQSGEWYHIAAVVRGSGDANQQTELWINGVLAGTGWYPGTWETQGLLNIPGYFSIGSSYWPLAGRNWQGQIDAVAISDTALSPGSFVYGPAVPEPASLLTLAVGFVGVIGSIRRRRS